MLIWLAALKPADTRGLADEAAAAEARLRPVRGIAWAMLAVVVLAPVFLGWYYLWALPLFAVSLGALWQERLERPLAVVATVVCFATLPEGYSLGLTTTAVGVPIAARRPRPAAAARAAHRPSHRLATPARPRPAPRRRRG